MEPDSLFFHSTQVVWPELTVREHLMLYARLKGILGPQRKAAANLAATKVQLDGDGFGLKAKELSGGMRRRLSIAAALVGEPKILILDEPTTGLDPDTRRQIWGIIQREKRPDRTIIITTHSSKTDVLCFCFCNRTLKTRSRCFCFDALRPVEEADTLCSRIGIMVQGKLRALGSQQVSC